MPPQDTVKWSGLCLLQLSLCLALPVPGSSKDQNIVDKKFNDNGHMITIGVNFHF